MILYLINLIQKPIPRTYGRYVIFLKYILEISSIDHSNLNSQDLTLHMDTGFQYPLHQRNLDVNFQLEEKLIVFDHVLFFCINSISDQRGKSIGSKTTYF